MKQYSNNYCQISYNPSTNQLYLKWLLPPDEAALLCGYDKGLDMAISNQAASWVTDNSIGFQVDLSMQHSLTQLVAGRIKQTAIKRFARVTPIDVFQELVTHKIIGHINDLTAKCIDSEVFHDPKDAKAWGTRVSLLSVN